MTWVYLINKKNDYLRTLQLFVAYVCKQFKTSVDRIRSDNALEFQDKECKRYFIDKGIHNETSCNYIPHQNGRVERKHGNILEMARCLRFQSSLSLSFWGDCVLLDVYIINRLPTVALQFKTPYELLFNETPSYNDLRTFGCLAFASNPSQTTDKFAPRGFHMCSLVIHLVRMVSGFLISQT